MYFTYYIETKYISKLSSSCCSERSQQQISRISGHALSPRCHPYPCAHRFSCVPKDHSGVETGERRTFGQQSRNHYSIYQRLFSSDKFPGWNKTGTCVSLRDFFGPIPPIGSNPGALGDCSGKGNCCQEA